MATIMAATAALASAGCSTNQGAYATPAERRAEINGGFERTMTTLYSSVPGSRELVARARCASAV